MLQGNLRREVHHIVAAMAEAAGGVDVLRQHQQSAAPIPTGAHLHRLKVGIHPGVTGHGHIQIHSRKTVAPPLRERLQRGVGAVIGVLQVQKLLIKQQPLQFVHPGLIPITGLDVLVHVHLDLITEQQRVDVWIPVLALVKDNSMQPRVRLKTRTKINTGAASKPNKAHNSHRGSKHSQVTHSGLSLLQLVRLCGPTGSPSAAVP